MRIITVIFLATVAIATACKPLIIIHGVAEPAVRLEQMATQLRLDSRCPCGLRNVTVVYLLQGVLSFIPIWTQVSMYQKALMPYFRDNPDGVSIIGYSQGSVVSRAVIEITDNHTVHTFISLAGCQMGLSGLPFIDTPFLDLMELLSALPNGTLSKLDYTQYISELCYNTSVKFSSCGYWRDPKQLDVYLQNCKFLPYINNEVQHNDSDRYRTNLLTLKKFVMIATSDEDVIMPWQSGHFASRSATGQIIPMEQQPIYINDTIGLKTLNEQNAIKRISVTTLGHAEIVMDYFVIENYIKPNLP